MAHTSKLILHIETIGSDFDSFDETTRDVLACQLHEDCEKGFLKRAGIGRRQLSMFPLMGEIVSIAVYDHSHGNGVVYYRAAEGAEKTENEDMKYRPAGTEKELLEHFWNAAGHYTEFVTFNGRQFTVPFLMVRSAINEIRASKDLMSDRKIGDQRFDALHVDLRDQMTFYGALEQPGGLHVWCKAFGIPHDEEDLDVDQLFENGEYDVIAKRAEASLKAISELYAKWDVSLRF